MKRETPIIAAVASMLLTLPAHAQCVYQTSLLDTWDRVGTPTLGATQHPQNGWRFQRSDTAADLVGLLNFSVGTNSWGAPDQAFLIPLIGPRYSNISGRNQALNFRRTPSFEGLLFHPGNTASIDAHAIISPQATVTLTGATLEVEHLGNSSANAIVRLYVLKGTTTTVLVPATTVPKLAPAQTLVASAGLPLTIDPGDQIVLAADNGGSALEDWVNANLTLSLDGPPLIISQPRDAGGCVNSPATLRVVAAGASSYQWLHNGEEIENATSSTLNIPALSSATAGTYECVVTNDCGSVTSAPATLAPCLANYNCDTESDILDFLDFIDDFASCENAPAPCGSISNADVNGDTFVDILDFLDFIDSFGSGC